MVNTNMSFCFLNFQAFQNLGKKPSKERKAYKKWKKKGIGEKFTK